MKLLIPMIAAALLAGPASAATYNISLTGEITSARSQGVDPNLDIGTIFTLTASFDAALLHPYGNNGDLVAGLYGLPAAGDSFWRVDAGDMTWLSTDSLADGLFGNKSPNIYINGDKVVGLGGYLSPAHISTRPELDFWGDGSSIFSITAPLGQYGDFYSTPGFIGAWDFANSSAIDPPSPSDFAPLVAVSAAPEPATWALFLLGFGAVGWTLRRRQVSFG